MEKIIDLGLKNDFEERQGEVKANEYNFCNQQNKKVDIKNPLKSNGSNKNFFDNLDDFDFSSNVNIKVFGLGGAGNNIVAHIAEHTNVNRECLYAINTDFQFLKQLPQNFHRILIGKTITKGMGSGSDPKIGMDAALEDENLFREKLKGTDLLFIVSGMGKGTGTGASPIVAQIAKEMGILTICVVNLPSASVEGQIIYEKGMKGLNELSKHADGLSVISNQKIIGENHSGYDISLKQSFDIANNLISTIVNEIISLVNVPAQMNLDFNDVKNFFKEKSDFQLNNFIFKSSENIKEKVLSEIKEAVYQNELIDISKVMVNFRLNPSVPQNFINDIRAALETALGCDDFTLTYAINYSDDVEFANFSLLMASLNQQKPKEQIKLHKTVELNFIGNIETRADVFENHNVENHNVINRYNTSFLKQENQCKNEEEDDQREKIENNNIDNFNYNNFNLNYRLDSSSEFNEKGNDLLSKWENVTTREDFNNEEDNISFKEKRQANSTSLNRFFTKTLNFNRIRNTSKEFKKS